MLGAYGAVRLPATLLCACLPLRLRPSVSIVGAPLPYVYIANINVIFGSSSSSEVVILLVG